MSLQLGKLQEKELFFQTLYLGLILRGASQLFYTFSSRVGIYRERGGDGTSSILCICLHSLLAKKIQSVKLKPRSNFSVQSFLLLVYLVFTLLLVLAFYSVNKCCFINIFHDIFLGQGGGLRAYLQNSIIVYRIRKQHFINLFEYSKVLG